MKFPRIHFAVTALLIATAITTACGGGPGGSRFIQPIEPPPPPTGTNYTTCDSQQVPNWQSSLFINAYQPAIKALVDNYASQPGIGYFRIGLGRGGEINLPQGWNQSSSGACDGGYSATWGYTVGAGSTWNAYLQTMVSYEGALGESSRLLVSITPINGENPNTETDDFIAGVANGFGISFGNQGLESSDIADFPFCGGDWCSLFAQYHPHISELQTLGQSCPTGASCVNSLATSTGPLPPLLAFATTNGANDLEIYYQDWLIAFDSDYASSIGASSQQATYAAAIQAAAATGAHMQVLFPPEAGDNTACGTTTCFAAVQALLNNSDAPVSGVVIDVDWSDIELTNGSFSFDITNAAIQPWAGTTVNLVLQNTTYGGSGSSCPSGIGQNGNAPSNCAMPSWMWTVLQ
jgi:hypothetical protein